ncbi:MAG: enoyl-CoA hydratase/isomerase family protein [Ignavibacteriales bacterium]|nr:enoyl-CoA hydratase/isomerase family protein [Ignavibacteriales bacterium]
MTESVDFTHIRYDVRQRVGTITLSRAEKHNALDDTMVAELSSAFFAAQKDSNVKVIILKAEGESFCSGADLAYIQRISKFDFNQNQQDSSNLMKLFLQIYTHRKPVIALVQGPALAGGCGLASVCDFVLAAQETAKFGYTEVRIGFIPAIVMVFLVRRIGEARARALTLRGNVISAEEAYQLGLLNQVVAAVNLERQGLELAQQLAEKCSSSSMGLIKELLARIHGMPTTDALDYAANLNALTRMTEDCKKGIESFLKKEPIKW